MCREGGRQGAEGHGRGVGEGEGCTSSAAYILVLPQPLLCVSILVGLQVVRHLPGAWWRVDARHCRLPLPAQTQPPQKVGPPAPSLPRRQVAHPQRVQGTSLHTVTPDSVCALRLTEGSASDIAMNAGHEDVTLPLRMQSRREALLRPHRRHLLYSQVLNVAALAPTKSSGANDWRSCLVAVSVC